MLYVLTDEWGNPFTTGKLTPEIKRNIMDGTLSCVSIDAEITPDKVKICSVDLEYEDEFEKKESWEDVPDVKKFIDVYNDEEE